MSGFSQLNIKLESFRSVTLFLVAIHLSASVAVMLANTPVSIQFGLVWLCAVSLWRCLHELLVAGQYITAMSLCPDEGWIQISNRKGDVLNIVTLQRYAVLPFLLVLYLTDESRCGHWFIVPRDAVKFIHFRRLSVVLSHHRILPNPAKQN